MSGNPRATGTGAVGVAEPVSPASSSTKTGAVGLGEPVSFASSSTKTGAVGLAEPVSLASSSTKTGAVGLAEPVFPASSSTTTAPRTLLVATAGGHLDELKILVRVLDIDVRNAVWVTSRNAQTEALLDGDEVVWVPPVGSGRRLRAASMLPMAMRVHRRIKPDRVVTTGALFTTPHLVAASLAGTPTWFIDSATRVSAPSSTGKFVSRFTRSKLYVQGDGWGDPRWTPVPGVFDSFVVQRSSASARPIRKAVVALGTEVWPFDRAVDRILELLPDADITWQVGVTDYVHRGEQLQRWLPPAELRSAMREADVVIAHAGVGTVLTALSEGKVPVVLPRRAAQREHVDDHQVEGAGMLDRRSLVVSVDPDELTYADLLRASGLESRTLRFADGEGRSASAATTMSSGRP